MSEATPSGSGGSGADRPGATLPARIGRYAIVRVLGEGGMGTVYEAQQDNPKRAVALKVVRAGFLSAELLRRFAHESQVLGRLQHPGIAQIYEAGVAQDERGQDVPFFAMEFVNGMPLNEHVRRKNLGTRARLELIAKISDAVYHAHQKGVIHRDLKPGNILVDEAGEPKVLDFGVARATDGDIQQTTLRTDVGQLIGTIPYMSPEQVGGDPGDLDTRSDVYALGVVAYELLAGRLPYDLGQKMIPEAARIIREEEPTRLSSFDRTLRGDVETIVAKALEKDKLRRYQSAESFASDIRRYLRDEPIAARPASTWYQIQKFSRRNAGLVAGVGAAFLLLIAGVFFTSVALRRALRAESGLQAQLAKTDAARIESDHQRKLAEANADAAAKARARAEAINAFVTKALESSDPMGTGRQDMPIAEAMQNAVREIESGAFRDDPETEAGLQSTIGRILLNVGKYAEAEPLLVQALATSERVFGGEGTSVARELSNLAQLREAQGRPAEAEPLLERSLALFEKALGPDHADVATTLNALGAIQFRQGQYDRAQPLYERALAIRERLFGPQGRDVALSLNDLALVHSAREDYGQAEPLLKQALAIYEKTLGPAHPDVAAVLNSLALLHEAQGQYAEAEADYVRALSICEKALGPDHPLVATGAHNLAELYRSRREYAKAEPLYEQALAIDEKALGPDDPEVALVLYNLANLYRDQGRYEQAEPLCARTLAIDEKHYGPDHAEVASDLCSLAHARQKLGRTAEARIDFDRAIGILRRQSPEGSAALARVLGYSAAARLENRDVAAALAECEEAVSLGEKFLPADHPSLAQYRQKLAECREAVEVETGK